MGGMTFTYLAERFMPLKYPLRPCKCQYGYIDRSYEKVHIKSFLCQKCHKSLSIGAWYDLYLPKRKYIIEYGGLD